jgi:hypothetical protein
VAKPSSVGDNQGDMTPNDSNAAARPTNPGPPTRAPDAAREGSYLVVRKKGAMLPPGCILCNLPEAGRAWMTVRKFNFPLSGPILVFSPILLLMYAVAPMTKFEAGFCRAHLNEGQFFGRNMFKSHYSQGGWMWVDGINPEYLQQFPEIGGEG